MSKEVYSSYFSGLNLPQNRSSRKVKFRLSKQYSNPKSLNYYNPMRLHGTLEVENVNIESVVVSIVKQNSIILSFKIQLISPQSIVLF